MDAGAGQSADQRNGRLHLGSADRQNNCEVARSEKRTRCGRHWERARGKGGRRHYKGRNRRRGRVHVHLHRLRVWGRPLVLRWGGVLRCDAPAMRGARGGAKGHLALPRLRHCRSGAKGTAQQNRQAGSEGISDSGRHRGVGRRAARCSWPEEPRRLPVRCIAGIRRGARGTGDPRGEGLSTGQQRGRAAPSVEAGEACAG
mmetsp:Transcript_2065/g.4884  ORF Transcript_2065/g.4884 Transcript_2065/m.4884 type:complete len:201 (+) Transcript_2065:4759-5361(+)